MENRTPAYVRKVTGLLPPPPRVRVEDPDGAPRVVVGEEDDAVLVALRNNLGDHGDELIYLGLLFFERPGSDAVDAAWKAAPLVFHDRRLVDTADDVIRLPPHLVGVPHDFSKTITKVLHRHPGPVSFFAVDSSACPGLEILAEWVDMLSEKAVRNLTVVNVSQPQELEFPLHRLRSDGTLISLGLAFFNLQGTIRLTLREYAEATFGALTTLSLAGCAFNGRNLACLILKCRLLNTLKISRSDLTAGCGGRGLTIEAQNLRTLELLQCTATTALTLHMRALFFLTMDVSPAQDSTRTWIRIHLEDVDALRELKRLLLDRQCFSFSTNLFVRVQGRRMVALSYMHSLSLGINMAIPNQCWAFIGLLHRTPTLSHLIIWRTDTPSDDEGQPWTSDEGDEVLSCKCVADYLHCLEVTDYRGGVAELQFIKAMLRRGRKLTEVTVTPHATLPLPRRKADSQLLKESYRVSALCCVTVKSAD